MSNSFIVIAKRQRDTLILGFAKSPEVADKLAQDSVITGLVAEAHVIETMVSYFESSVNRANPDTDTSRSETPTGEAPEPGEHSLNPASKKDIGEGTEKPVVTEAEALKLTEPSAKSGDKNKAAPKA